MTGRKQNRIERFDKPVQLDHNKLQHIYNIDIIYIYRIYVYVYILIYMITYLQYVHIYYAVPGASDELWSKER